jgi:hypothetical protein
VDLSAVISDASGVGSVTLTWAVGTAAHGTSAMTLSGGRYHGTAGPVPNTALGPNPGVTWTVTATDTHGNSSGAVASGIKVPVAYCVI